MKILLLDTNVYGWSLEKPRIKNLLEKISEQKSKEKPDIIVMGCDTILNEIRATKDRKLRGNLRTSYQSVISGSISLSKKIIELATEYVKEAKIQRVKIEDHDALIVASGTIAGIHSIVSENRLTMRNPKAIKIYEKINRMYKLKTPKIIDASTAYESIFL